MRRALVALLALLAAVPATASASHDEPLLGRPGVFTCGGLPFPQSAFRNPTGAESGDDGPAAALRETIRSFNAQDADLRLPEHGWRVLAATRDEVQFHNGSRPAGGGLYGWGATAELEDGGWRVRSFGQCGAWRVADGHEIASISLRGRPRSTSRTLTFNVLTGRCSSEDPAGRFERFEVRETRHTVTVLALMRPEPPLPPDTACPAIGYVFPKRVRLERPLGRRVVRDGGRFPPAVLGRGR